MKISKIGNIVSVLALLVSAGFAGMLSVEFAVSALLFSALVRVSVHWIERAIDDSVDSNKFDRH